MDIIRGSYEVSLDEYSTIFWRRNSLFCGQNLCKLSPVQQPISWRTLSIPFQLPALNVSLARTEDPNFRKVTDLFS